MKQFAQKALNIVAVMLLCLMLLRIALSIVSAQIVSLPFLEEPSIGMQIFRYTVIVLTTCLILLVGMVAFLSLFGSEEEEQKKESSSFSPLIMLTKEQEEAITQLLRDLPEHDKKAGHINMALTAQYLTALYDLGYLDFTDKKKIRLWLEQATGRHIPSTSAFNEALPSKNKDKVAAAQKDIQRRLERLR